VRDHPPAEKTKVVWPASLESDFGEGRVSWLEAGDTQQLGDRGGADICNRVHRGNTGHEPLPLVLQQGETQRGFYQVSREACCSQVR
jgi:hypothetical protein